MNRTEKALALHLAAALAAAVAIAVLQAAAGGLVARGLDVADAPLFGDLGLRKAGLFKVGLFLTVFPLAVEAIRGEAIRGEAGRRLAGGFLVSAILGWLAAQVVFAERETGTLFLLAGVAATLAGRFDGWRRLAAAEALGLAVTATGLASAGESLLEGRTFFAAGVVGLLVIGPLVAAAASLPEAVDRVLEPAPR